MKMLNLTSVQAVGRVERPWTTFYVDDFSFVVDPPITEEVLASVDLFRLKDRPTKHRKRPYSRHPFHDCDHSHIDGAIVFGQVAVKGSSQVCTIVANQEASADGVLLHTTGWGLLVPLFGQEGNGYLEWGSGSQIHAIRYHRLRFGQSKSTIGIASYTGDRESGLWNLRRFCFEKRSEDGRTVQIYAEEMASSGSENSGVIPGEIGYGHWLELVEELDLRVPASQPEHACTPAYRDFEDRNVDLPSPDDIEKIRGKLHLGIMGTRPFASHADDHLFYDLMDAVIAPRVNFLEIALGMRELPLPDIKWHSRATAGRTMRTAAGTYLSAIYGILPIPEDHAAIRRVPEVLRERIAPYLRSYARRKNFAWRDWKGIQCISVGLQDVINRCHPSIEEVLNQTGPLRVGHGLSFHSGADLFEDASRRLQQMGIRVTPAEAALTLWEVVPFSFVADWWTGISNKLENLSISQLWHTLPVDYVCRSVKAKRSLNEVILDFIPELRSFTVTISVTATVYDRHYDDHVPDVLPVTTHDTSAVLRHWLEGSALLVGCGPKPTRAKSAS